MSGLTKHSKTKPLSAYNLFFQYNRIKLHEATNGKVVAPPESISSAPPGLEHIDSDSMLFSAPDHEIRRHRKQAIEHTLDNSPFGTKGKRSKKISQGSMTFLEMSNYMSKIWNDADETTKSIFQELSSERKAKAQRLEFNLYKKSAEKFALDAKSAMSGNINAKSASMPILSGRIVSLDTTGSSFGLWTESVQSSSPSMANATWDEPLPTMNNNAAAMGTFFQPRPFKKVTSVDLKPINMVRSLSNDIRSSSESMNKSFSSGSFKSIKSMRLMPSKNNVQSSAFKLKSASVNISNFDCEQPFLDSRLDQETLANTIESFGRPLSPSGENVTMVNDELCDWLSGIDWNQI